MQQTRKIAQLGLLTALAMILSYVELLLPPLFAAVPGIKIGLPNIIVIYVLYRFGLKWTLGVSLTRVVLVAALFGNAVTLMYSLSGAILSIFIMYFLKRINIFSHIGVSVAGGVTHNLGQIIVAMIVLGTAEIGYYMAVLTATGTLSGILVGLLGAYLLRRTEKEKKSPAKD